MNSIKTVSALTLLTIMVSCSSQKASLNTNSLTSLSDVNRHISQTLFNYVDKNNDVKVSKKEFTDYSEEKKRLQELKHVQSIITSCDKNGDNQISLDEVPKRYDNSNPVGVYDIELKELCFISQYEFSAKDKNHDNILTAGELLAKNNVIPYPIVEDINSEERDKRREASLKRHYELCDKNSDGKLSLAEATTKKCRIPSEIFIESDSNKDNFLTLEEISKGAKEHEQRVPIVTPVRPIKLPPTMPVEIRMMIKLTTCDTNRDRKLSEEEAVSCNFSKEVFKESDKNKDGFFSEEDMTIFNLLRQFKRIDKNGDGYLDIKEFQEGDNIF